MYNWMQDSVTLINPVKSCRIPKLNLLDSSWAVRSLQEFNFFAVTSGRAVRYTFYKLFLVLSASSWLMIELSLAG